MLGIYRVASRVVLSSIELVSYSEVSYELVTGRVRILGYGKYSETTIKKHSLLKGESVIAIWVGRGMSVVAKSYTIRV
jgi:hypothetical protein